MSTNTVQKIILGFINDELNDDEVALEVDTRLFDMGFVDSMNLVRLLAFLEKDFDLKIPVAMVNDQNFATVSSIAELIDSIREPSS